MIRAYRQGVSIYVIGTEDASEACGVAGISPKTHHWSGTEFGRYVRRQGRWRLASEFRTPKDAKPGVRFAGPIRATEESL